MRIVYRVMGLAVLVLALAILTACGRPSEPTPLPATPSPAGTAPAADTPTLQPQPTAVPDTPTPAETPEPTPVPVSDADLEAGLATVRSFLALLANGDFRQAYGEYLTTAGQEQLAELVLGRLALTNPHISIFEMLGAEAADGRVAVDVTWEEVFDGQGLVGTQNARILLARQDDAFLVDDVQLGDYLAAATPVPPPLPRAQALVNPVTAGEDLRFEATGFQSGETILAWLELPDGTLLGPAFQTTDDEGSTEATYPGTETAGRLAGRWIWWVQALRDSSRNTGIAFDVLEAPTPTATNTPQPRPQPTATRRPTATAGPTATAVPSAGYPAPVLLWPEPLTSREHPGGLVVDFVAVADNLAEDEFYELVLIAYDPQGNVYNAGSVRGKGDACSTQYAQPCRSLIGDVRFMQLFYPNGFEGDGRWYVQVVRQTGPDQFTVISPPSETRRVLLKPR